MTTYRVDEFNEDEDIDNIEFEAEGREDPENSLESRETKEDSTPFISEVIEPRTADTTRRIEKPIQIETKTTFKTKCQLMQEEVENGKLFVY